MLPGCDYNHWLIDMELPKGPAPTREQMIDTYLDTLATVLGSMEEAKKNMYAFSTTTYTGFQCTVSEETSEKFKGLPVVLWVLPDSYIDKRIKIREQTIRETKRRSTCWTIQTKASSESIGIIILTRYKKMPSKVRFSSHNLLSFVESSPTVPRLTDVDMLSEHLFLEKSL
ncbi:hypothetical protein J1N35_028338 [Gossypium stocksii]|uniref:MORF/ORRM1/DAG-like MORF domain-containing protein n=1 Tax=Gossypium stocksii TaxID=47602 RepID=A0A9D3ZR08_9ROSI|nr:hypothetical protein J1N35_028338 [Gossypium stocksii]